MTGRRNSTKYFFLSLTRLTSVTILCSRAGLVFYLMPKFGAHLHKSRNLPIPKLSSPSIDEYTDSTKQQKDLRIVHNYQAEYREWYSANRRLLLSGVEMRGLDE